MNNRSQLRLWLIPPLLGIAAYCAYGVLATLEPGADPAWRIAYGAGLILCPLACVVIWFLTANPKA